MNEDIIIQDVLAGLLGPALIEGKDDVVDWLTTKIQSGYPKLFDNIMKYATDQAFYEDKDYKPSNRVKDLARKYYGPIEEDSGMSEQEAGLREDMGTLGELTPDNTDDLYTGHKDTEPIKEMGLDAVKPKKDSVPEQIEGLAELLKGY